MKDEIIFLISIILLSLSSIALGYVAQPQIESMISRTFNNYGENPEECANMSLVDTSHCLRDHVEKFYKYTVTQDIRKLTLEELKENGGDCKNYAELYSDYAEELGFYAKRPLILTGENKGHTFAIISDETGYCILDQLTVSCHGVKS